MRNKFELTSFQEQNRVFKKLFDRHITLTVKVPGADKTEVVTHYNSGDRNDMPYFAGVLCHMADGGYVISLRADIWTEAKFRGREFKTLSECAGIMDLQLQNEEVIQDFIDSGEATGYIAFRFADWADVVHFFWNTMEMYDIDPNCDGWSVFYGIHCDDCSTPIAFATSILGQDAKPFEDAAEAARQQYSAEREADWAA